MKILVTGGAGYIGSVVADQLINSGHDITVIDSLSQGHRAAVHPDARLVVANICDAVSLEKAFKEQHFDAVVHLAGETAIQFSMTDPGKFFNVNVGGGLNLLESMRKHSVPSIIFSSTAAVYGEPLTTPIEENHPTIPVNSYGESKLIFERLLKWYGRAYGIRHVSLRYFNAAGAYGNLGESHNPETHLIPNILKAALTKHRCTLSLYGRDYPTADGTCIRDYVHVSDIAQAHVLAIEKLKSPDILSGIINSSCNLGSGQGISNLQVIEAARRITGVNITVTECPRRNGDPAILVASSSKAVKELGWTPKYTTTGEIIESAWKWINDHPDGYGE